MNLIKKYYEIQAHIDIGWGEFSWFNDSLIELMAIIYILEKLGVIVEGSLVYIILISAFIFFYLFGRILKVFKIYDKRQYVEAEIDPVMGEILEAARKINEKHRDTDISSIRERRSAVRGRADNNEDVVK
jgi:spore germination protein GerM